MRILVTGSSGFVGTTFCERFHKKFEVVAVDWKPPKERFPGVKYYEVDVLDIGQLKEVFYKECPQRVVHLAAQARVDASLVNPIGTFRINVVGTINLLEMAKLMNLSQFIYVSSEVIYGKAESYPCSEIQSFNPSSPYAASKVSADILTQSIEGVNWVVARPGMGFGPRSDPNEQVVAKFLWNVLHNKPLRFPSGKVQHPTRDINYIGNFMDGLSLLITQNLKFQIYNLGSGRETSILELAEKIVEVTGRGEIAFDPNFHYRAGEEGMRTWLDISKAKAEFGYEPRVGLEDGLRITYKWMKRNISYWD